MKFKRSFLVLTVLMLILSLFFTGCAKDASQNETQSPEKLDDTQEEKDQDDADVSEEDGEMLGNMYKTGLPIVKDKVTLRIAVQKMPLHSKDFDEMELIKKTEEKTNVHIEWEAIPSSSWTEKKNLMFAGGDLPDAFFPALTPADEIMYGGQGLLIPLEDLIEEWAPNIKDAFEKMPEVKPTITTPDGHIYALPTLVQPNIGVVQDSFLINKTWLDKVDLSIPTTTDEFHQVLKAFKENDVNDNGDSDDEIPFSFIFRGENRHQDIYSLFGSFGLLDTPEHIILEEGEVIFTADKEEHKEALKYFHKLYKDGLIDQEAFTQDEKQYTAKGNADPVILGAFLDWRGENIVGAERFYNDYVVLEPLKGPDGHQQWNRVNDGINKGSFAITSANEYPEITMRWIDQLYDQENALEWAYGPVGVTAEINDEGKYENLDPPEGMTWGEFRHSATPGNAAVYGLLEETMKNDFVFMQGQKAKMEQVEVYMPYTPDEIYPLVYFTDEQQQQLSTFQTDIEQYVTKMQAKWITEGGIDDDWDEYINQLNKMGLEDYIKIYQDAYDVYLESK